MADENLEKELNKIISVVGTVFDTAKGQERKEISDQIKTIFRMFSYALPKPRKKKIDNVFIYGAVLTGQQIREKSNAIQQVKIFEVSKLYWLVPEKNWEKMTEAFIRLTEKWVKKWGLE